MTHPRGHWSADDIPNLTGRHALVTGANSGIGFVTALELARHGCKVTVAVRDVRRGEVAVKRIGAMLSGSAGAGDLQVQALDLADLSSVHACAEAVISSGSALDLLINNAGVMAIPRRESADGFEMQLATNHLGHQALTGLLLPLLVATGRAHPELAPARIVTVSSGAHRFGKIDFADLQSARDYRPWRAYGQSKLANLLFTFELQRRLEAAALPVAAYAAHPGYASTNLASVGPVMSGSRLRERIMAVIGAVVAQSAEMGALPTLYAATLPELPGGSYVGPDGFGEQRGHPQLVGTNPAARDEAVAGHLFAVTEDLTGVHFDVAALAGKV